MVPLTPCATTEDLRDFFAALVHAILRARAVYPHHAFHTRRLFDLPVHRARHAKLIAYIDQVVDAAIELKERNELHALVVLILDAEQPTATL